MSCCHTFADGTPCRFKATQEYEGKKLCKVHLNKIKSSEDCPICFSPMTSNAKEKRIKLKCGHYFHIGCLAKCMKPECPICREQLDPVQAMTIFDATLIKPIALTVFSLPKVGQTMAYECIRLSTALSTESAWHMQAVYIMLAKMEREKNNKDRLGTAINTFLQLLV